jgi:TolB-like protein
METERHFEPGAPVSSGSVRIGNIRAHVDRLLASPDFHIPARRARLLRYLVDRAAAGQGEQINEYSIGVDVFERPASFDPKIDAVVRAEVSRLRQNLKEHYARGSYADGTILELPARSYVPVFRSVPPAVETARAPIVAQPAQRTWAWILAGMVCALAVGMVLGSIPPRPVEPPALSLAVLPAAVTPAARDFEENADAFSEELAGALWRTPGLSMLDWQSVSGFRGAGALRDARNRLPVALILATEIDRRGGTLVVTFRMYDRQAGSAVWSTKVPLGDARQLRVSAEALAGSYLSPVLERDFNIVSYRALTGRSRIQPALSGPAMPENPCAARTAWFAGIGRPAAQIEIGAVAGGARSKDTRIEIFADGQRAYPLAMIAAKAGIPVYLQAPALVQLAEDTCVATTSSGTIPVYGGNCVVPPPGYSQLRLLYTCGPKARPIDIGKFTNDWSAWNEEMFPAGPRILDGVPFLIPDGPNRLWHAGAGDFGARPATLNIPVKQPAVSEAFFLMNTIWGQGGPESYLTLAFDGDRGAHFDKKLIGGTDVRDYNRGAYTNTINGTSTRPGFDNGHGQRMDLLEVDLPREFRQQTLETITIRDTGRFNSQRAILWALSVR